MWVYFVRKHKMKTPDYYWVGKGERKSRKGGHVFFLIFLKTFSPFELLARTIEVVLTLEMLKKPSHIVALL
jgi:hypothetical protein